VKEQNLKYEISREKLHLKYEHILKPEEHTFKPTINSNSYYLCKKKDKNKSLRQSRRNLRE
jgi:hypothetical protein